MKARIVLTDEIVADARDHCVPIKTEIENHYEGEIADLCRDNEKLKSLNGLELCMFSAGLSKKSRIKDFYTTQDNDLLFPAVIDTRLAETVAKNPMLNYIVEGEQMIDATSVKALTLDWTAEDNQKALLKRDVSEGADLPIVKVQVGSKAISLYKRGVAVQTTYEAVRHTSLELFMRTLNAIAAHSAHQQMGDAVAVLLNGDGNDNAPLVSATAAADLTKNDVVDLCLDFYDANNGLILDTILTGRTWYRKLLDMVFPTDEAAGYHLGASFKFPQGVFGDITVVYEQRVTDEGGKPRLIGLNRANALTRYIENGSIISEVAANIRNQTKLGTLSETVGFAKLVNTASRVLKGK